MTQFLNIETNELEFAPLTSLKLLKADLWYKHGFINQYIFITQEQSEYIQLCDDCGKIINLNNDDYVYTHDNCLICEDCYYDYDCYFTCEQCGQIYSADSILIINADSNAEKFICPDCCNPNNGYYKCDDCGQWYTHDYVYRDSYDNIVCHSCFDNYEFCEHCQEIIYIDEVTWYTDEDDNEYPLCDACYSEVDNDSKYIHKYGYTPHLHFIRTINDKTATYYGLEIEVAGNKKCAKNFLDFFPANQVYLTLDSTVAGFEITTHPMTYNYLQSQFKEPLENAMNYLKDNDFRGHNKGGMHIHVSRAGINNIQFALLNVLLYCRGDSKQAEQLLTITQRLNSNLSKYASPYVNTYIPVEIFNECIHHKRNFVLNRCTALNDRNDTTFEFRIFNSSLRIERIYKNIEFVQALLDFTAQYKFLSDVEVQDILDEITLDNLFIFIEKTNHYPNLLAFLYEKELLEKPVTTQLTLLEQVA